LARAAINDPFAPLREDILGILREAGIPEETAVRMCSQMMVTLHARYAGDKLYITSGAIRDERDAQVRRDFNGTNHATVCRTHGISRVTLWRILKSGRGAA
jgi:Mor family transcriptional regulator